MFHPTRPGCRGGHGEFDWRKIRFDKDRQNYLGNSVRAPHSRYGKDLFWYARKEGSTLMPNIQETASDREKRQIKEREAKLMQFYVTNGMGAKPPPDFFDPVITEEMAVKDAASAPPLQKADVSRNASVLERDGDTKSKQSLDQTTIGSDQWSSQRHGQSHSYSQRPSQRHNHNQHQHQSYTQGHNKNRTQETRNRERSPDRSRRYERPCERQRYSSSPREHSRRY